MNFSCDQCHRRYSLPDERVAGKSVKVRCKNCQHLIQLGPASAPAARGVGVMATVAAPAAASSAAPQWFAMVRGKQEGPFNLEALGDRVHSGDVSPRSYLWRGGLKDWQCAAEIDELASLFNNAHSLGKPAASGRPRMSGDRPRMSGEHAVEALDDKTIVSIGTPFSFEDKRMESLFDEDSPATLVKGGSAMMDPVAESEKHKATRADVRSQSSEPRPSVARLASKPAALSAHRSVEGDPFRAVSGEGSSDQLVAPGDSTRFFIAQAGVNKRNPPWKIAAFAGGGVGLLLGLFYMLTALNVVPTQIKHTNAAGNQVKTSVFSSEGMSALRAMLMDKKQRKAPPRAGPKPTPGSAERRALAGASSGRSAGSPAGEASVESGLAGGGRTSSVGSAAPDSDLSSEPSSDVKRALTDRAKRDVDPSVRKQEPAEAEKGDAALPQEAVQKVISRTQPAFQFCIEQQLKRNPNFKGGKVNLIATVGASGVVKGTKIDRRDIDESDLGGCIKGKAKRMSFPAFAGDDVDLEIPLILTARM